MNAVAILALVLVITAVVVVVSAPLRRTVSEDSESSGAGDTRDELHAEREAKYREIRDAELDHRTGKLSDEDHRELDRALRAEAVQILRRIDALERPS